MGIHSMAALSFTVVQFSLKMCCVWNRSPTITAAQLKHNKTDPGFRNIENTMSVDNNLGPRSTAGLADYPSSGAFSHLPIRTTITGDAMISHPNADKIFLRNLPSHCYTLPNVPLNFTLVEIIVLLPNWFKNRAIATRFMNNHLTANVHFTIFEEHRECNFENDHEQEKARKTITDEYRKTMRSYPHNRAWTKAKHTPALGWNSLLISMDGFKPDDAWNADYRRLPSVPLRDLMIGVKKLPEGSNAGDLTRCVQFSLGRPENFLFPDDLSQILQHIGRTQITTAHTDRPIVRGYVERMRKARHAVTQMQLRPTDANAVQQLSQPSSHALWEYNQSQAHYAAIDQFDEQLDALLQPRSMEGFQMPEAPAAEVLPIPYHPRRLLRECIEGHVAFDGSLLARAARFAQQPEQISTEWYVENVPLLIELLDAAPFVERMSMDLMSRDP